MNEISYFATYYIYDPCKILQNASFYNRPSLQNPCEMHQVTTDRLVKSCKLHHFTTDLSCKILQTATFYNRIWGISKLEIKLFLNLQLSYYCIFPTLEVKEFLN